jgi:hypothetical protein
MTIKVDVQRDGQQFADSAAAETAAGASASPAIPELISEITTELEKRCRNPKCGQVLDAESMFRARCSRCKCVLTGNQIKRKYPKPAIDDPQVQEQLALRRDQIIGDKGGTDRLSTMQLGDIGRYVVLEAFVQSWEHYFMKASPISRQGRVRSGYREGYLSSLDRLMKLGAQIGVERVTRDVADLTFEEYVQQQPHEEPDEQQQRDADQGEA